MVKPPKLRWGLLSTSRINRSLIGPIRASKRSTLVGVASRSGEKAQEYAKSWEIPRFYSNYEALLADPEIDIIYNALPNALHAEWSIKAMQAGKHVLCEKPLTTKSSDVDEVIIASQKTGMVITEAFMYRHHPQTRLVKQMIDRGEIGTLQLIRGSFCYMNSRPGDVRLDPALGGGCLWDVGCYPVSYARYITGKEIISVYGSQVMGITGVDMQFTGQILFPDSISAQFDCSFITPYRVLMEFTGSKGRIIVPEPYKPGKRTKIFLEQDGKTTTIDVKGEELYHGEVRDIEDAVLIGSPNLVSLNDSKANLQAIEVLYESARSGKAINLNL